MVEEGIKRFRAIVYEMIYEHIGDVVRVSPYTVRHAELDGMKAVYVAAVFADPKIPNIRWVLDVTTTRSDIEAIRELREQAPECVHDYNKCALMQ